MITIQEKWTMKDPLNCIGYNMATCYGTRNDNIEKNIKRAKTHIEAHGRLQELPDIYVTIEGYSAKCLRELYTHIGCLPTRLQSSTRYLDYEKGFDFVIPPTVKTEEQLAEWNEAMHDVQRHMTKLKELGVPKEDYSNLLPLAYESKMVWKVNLRCLINFMNMRLCTRAYWEIRRLANELKDALANYSDEWRWIAEKFFVPKCETQGYCTEHECCGRKPIKKNVDEILANYSDVLKELN